MGLSESLEPTGMITAIVKLPYLRPLLILFLSLTWATMGSATSAAERGDFDPYPIAAKTPLTVNEATIADALKGSTMQTTQGKVSLPVVEAYVRKLEAGQVPPDIKVDGGVMVEGNHRYVAGRVYGTEPPVVSF
jgi:hypothetical protein